MLIEVYIKKKNKHNAKFIYTFSYGVINKLLYNIIFDYEIINLIF